MTNSTAPSQATTPATAEAALTGVITSVPHTMTRRTIASRLTQAKQQVPHFYLDMACRMDALLELRKQINNQRDKDNTISVNDFLVRAMALAQVQTPAANVAWGEDALSQFQHADVAVAVATSRGLITPIVRNADTKSVADMSSELKELFARARKGRLHKEEYTGGTISLSNLGMFGVESFSAIVNPPQSCILAVGAAEQKAVVQGGEIIIATMMSVTLSVDHRSVDGAIAAQLLQTFKKLVEQPQALL